MKNINLGCRKSRLCSDTNSVVETNHDYKEKKLMSMKQITMREGTEFRLRNNKYYTGNKNKK
jgi:hypothetical protein